MPTTNQISIGTVLQLQIQTRGVGALHARHVGAYLKRPRTVSIIRARLRDRMKTQYMSIKPICARVSAEIERNMRIESRGTRLFCPNQAKVHEGRVVKARRE